MIPYQLNLSLQSGRSLLTDMVFTSGDSGGYRLLFSFFSYGARFDVTGFRLSIKARRADGSLVFDSGVITETGEAYYDVKSSVYAVPGELSIEVGLLLENGDFVTAKELCATVREGFGEEGLLAEDTTPIIAIIMEQQELCRQATEAASDAAKEALLQSEKLANLSVSAETLAPGSEVTVTKSESQESVQLSFGIPKGDKLLYEDLTETEKEELTASVIEAMPTWGSQTKPEFANSIEECTDKTKVYVLPDGYIYAYMTKTGYVKHYGENKFVASGATINKRMGSSSLSAQNGYVWSNPIAVDLTESSPFKIKVEGTQIAQCTTEYQKIWLCSDASGTTKLSAGVLLVGQKSENYTTLLEDGTIYADYKGGAKLSDSILASTKSIRIGFKFSDSAIGSTSELSGVSITFPHENYTEETTTTGWQNTGHAFVPADYEDRIADLEKESQDHEKRLIILENDSTEGKIAVPTFWESAVDGCIAKIKTLQSGRDCVTFAFFSDNHQNTKYVGSLIGKVMQDCHIPYCFFGGDAIDSGNLADEAAMIANDKAFDEAMSVIDVDRMCRAVGNHDGYWLDNNNVKHRYTRPQIYDLFLRQESVAQNKHYGGDGTFYYVDDLASETRFVVCNTNYNVNTATETLDSQQLAWLSDVVFNEDSKAMKLVFISHQPITNNHHSNIYADTAHAIQELLTNKINAGWDVVGWFSGHIHADRIYQTDHTSNTEANDQTTVTLPWKTVTIRADHTGLCRDEDFIHTVAEDDQSHAIDFVTINKSTRTVSLTRLGIGDDRSYVY